MRERRGGRGDARGVLKKGREDTNARVMGPGWCLSVGGEVGEDGVMTGDWKGKGLGGQRVRGEMERSCEARIVW